jgi:Flp pilus assembly protein TadB
MWSGVDSFTREASRMTEFFLVLSPPCLVLAIALRTYLVSYRVIRSSRDVLRDLLEAEAISPSPPKHERGDARKVLHRYLPLMVGSLVYSVTSWSVGGVSTSLFIVGGVATSLTYLIQKRIESLKQERRQHDLEFFLPVVMERIVMAVQAGLDIIPALEAVYSLGEKEAVALSTELDPVTKLLGHVIEKNRSGQGLEEALAQVGKESQTTGVRHAFIHLSLAHREGGELMTPLRELSDATQLYYQETVEEIISKLPIKATLPLLCTFAGLIICFLTVPIIEVMTMTKQSIPSVPTF